MPARALILTYHSANVGGRQYAENDHVALAADLPLIAASGWRFASLDEVVEKVLDQAGAASDECLLALTCDDGITLDYRDFEHPIHGPQRSFSNILGDFISGNPGLPHAPHLDCFVIASPEARQQLDTKDFLGLGLWDDQWWAPANQAGLLSIQNHSWDHNHPTVDPTAHKHNRRGSFSGIDTESECAAEIDQASAYIEAVSGRRPRHFAWPWGQASHYARHEYLPQHAAALGLVAAWSCEPGLVQAGSERWFLPRLVCGQHWRSTAELAELLQRHRTP